MNEEENVVNDNIVENESGSVEELISEEEPVIQKVIDIDKRRKIIILCIIVSLIVIAGISYFVFFKNDVRKEKANVEKRITNDYSNFVNTINYSISNGDFDKEISKALKDVSINTSELLFVCLDIDSDDDNELVAYVEEDNNKYVLIFEIDEDVMYEDSFQVNSIDSLGYAYSFKDEKNYWFTDYASEYTIIKHPKRVIKVNDFLDGFYTITKQYKGHAIFENATLYKSGYKLDVNKLEEDSITSDRLFEDNTIDQEKIVEDATKYKTDKDKAESEKEAEKQKREIELEDQNDVFSLNNKLMNYGNYVETGSSLYGKIVIHKNGTCEIGENECTWSYGMFDFGTGSLEQSLDIHKETDVFHFKSGGENIITNGNGWTAAYK